ncbi:MAG: hypothetical protein AAF481_16745 [Acidobacteriota bacterium]
MRTTLTIDDDVAGRLKEQAEKRGLPFKVVVNETLRAGLGPHPSKKQAVPKVRTHSFGFRPDIDLDRMNHLADDLEAEAFARKLEEQQQA